MVESLICQGPPKSELVPPKVTLLYGDTDWMDARAGAWLVRELGKSYPTEMTISICIDKFCD